MTDAPQFLLDPNWTFLNHGSFGATPREILDAQIKWRHQMERQPVRFVVDQLQNATDAARKEAGRLLGANPANLAFVSNATTGVNAVMRSLSFRQGDEVLTTNHRYQAVRNTLDHICDRTGAKVVEAHIPFPLHSSEDIFSAVCNGFTSRTTLLVVDQISSPTALIFPVARLIQEAKSRGIAVLVDGAHAPGQLGFGQDNPTPRDCPGLDDLGADFWVGNLHKWICAPKGAAVLWVADEHRPRIHAPAISHGYKQGIHAEFDWCGTFDPTAWLASADAIRLHETMGGATLREANHQLVRAGRKIVADAIGAPLPHPDDPQIYGSMATIPLGVGIDHLQDVWRVLTENHRVEAPIVPLPQSARDQSPGQCGIRISGFAGYNVAQDYERLAAVLPSVVGQFTRQPWPTR